jgi:hypothetical protein
MRTSRRTPLLAVLSVLAAFAFVAGACGSDSDSDESSDDTEATSPPETVAEEDTDAFVAELDEFCAEADATATEAGEALNAALEDLGAADTSGDQVAYAVALEEATTAVEDVLEVFADFDAALADLDVPADLQSALDDFVAVKDEQKALAEDLLDAIVADDGDAFTEVTGELEATEAEFDEATAEAAEAMGTDECLPDD